MEIVVEQFVRFVVVLELYLRPGTSVVPVTGRGFFVKKRIWDALIFQKQ